MKRHHAVVRLTELARGLRGSNFAAPQKPPDNAVILQYLGRRGSAFEFLGHGGRCNGLPIMWDPSNTGNIRVFINSSGRASVELSDEESVYVMASRDAFCELPNDNGVFVRACDDGISMLRINAECMHEFRIDRKRLALTPQAPSPSDVFIVPVREGIGALLLAKSLRRVESSSLIWLFLDDRVEYPEFVGSRIRVWRWKKQLWTIVEARNV